MYWIYSIINIYIWNIIIVIFFLVMNFIINHILKDSVFIIFITMCYQISSIDIFLLYILYHYFLSPSVVTDKRIGSYDLLRFT